LRLLTEKIMGVKLPETHDSVQDARAALLVAAYVSANGPPPGLTFGTSSLDGPQLLIHRIPANCTEEQLYRMLIAYTQVAPVRISTINHGTPTTGSTEATGKAYATYSDAQHMELAFETLTGPVRPDKSNRPQKRVYLKKGGYVCIRK
jgi:hypothetical protein